LFVGAVLLLPVLYALSIGPTVWLAEHGHLSEPTMDALEIFYAPLGWAESDSAFSRAVTWYINLW
jgi:hypothetical protein